MKTIILALATLTLFASCKKEDTENNQTPKNLISQVKSAQLIEASNDFTFNLLKVNDSLTAGHNAFVSPLSVQQALSMTLNGAAGQTWTEMAEAMAYKDATEVQINEYNKSLTDALLNADDQVKFEIANSIWPRLGFQVEQNFTDVNREFYNAEVNVADFADPQTLTRINNWCSNKTHGKIPHVLDNIPSDAVMYLINALYFKGTWKYAFDKSKTSRKTFYKEDGSEVLHDQMVVEAKFEYYKGTDFSLVALPYGIGNFRMMLLLPEYGKSLSEICKSLNSEIWNNAIQNMQEQTVIVRLPKFTFEFESLMNSTLTQMGMGIIFSPFADFSKINKEGGLCISRVIHKTFVDVNEEGTEAAAVTVVEIVETSMPDYYTFEANRPFMYFITEKSTGSVIFAGKMVNPEEKSFKLE